MKRYLGHTAEPSSHAGSNSKCCVLNQLKPNDAPLTPGQIWVSDQRKLCVLLSSAPFRQFFGALSLSWPAFLWLWLHPCYRHLDQAQMMISFCSFPDLESATNFCLLRATDLKLAFSWFTFLYYQSSGCARWDVFQIVHECFLYKATSKECGTTAYKYHPHLLIPNRSQKCYLAFVGSGWELCGMASGLSGFNRIVQWPIDFHFCTYLRQKLVMAHNVFREPFREQASR